MDIFVLPSLWEGLPNAALEAMAAGLPVVATNVDGVPEAVENHVNGLLCEPGDSQALFETIQHLIVRPEDRELMGAEGRRIASERFGLPRMLAAWQGALERAAA
jgi:glycosyltransferase involved in cell wall biosynthesis